MQVCCELCQSEFYMSAKCKTKHPKCRYCRSGMDPEESRINNEMDEALDGIYEAYTGTTRSKPDTEVIEAWGVKHMIEKELRRQEADEFFYETPSSDK